MTPDPTPPASSDTRSPFERFRDLTQRILTTPKSELVKDAPKQKAVKTTKEKRK